MSIPLLGTAYSRYEQMHIRAVILGSVALSVLKRLAWRACALKGLGVLPSIRQGYAVLAHHRSKTGRATGASRAIERVGTLVYNGPCRNANGAQWNSQMKSRLIQYKLPL